MEKSLKLIVCLWNKVCYACPFSYTYPSLHTFFIPYKFTTLAHTRPLHILHSAQLNKIIKGKHNRNSCLGVNDIILIEETPSLHDEISVE